MTHYIKFQYTRWDRWKRLTKEYSVKVWSITHRWLMFGYCLLLFGLGWLGFFGRDPKFFPDGGLFGRIKTKLKGKAK